MTHRARLGAPASRRPGGPKARIPPALYNARPKWLTDAHATLDAAIAAAYGWETDIDTDDALRELLALNLCA